MNNINIIFFVMNLILWTSGSILFGILPKIQIERLKLFNQKFRDEQDASWAQYMKELSERAEEIRKAKEG